MEREPFLLEFSVNGRFQREPALALQYVDDFAVTVVSDEHGLDATVPDAIGSGFEREILERNHNVHAKAGERPFHFGVEAGAACIGRGLRMNSACLNFVCNLVEVGHAEPDQGNEW